MKTLVELMSYDVEGGIDGLIELVKRSSMKNMIKPDPKFGTSPISR